MSKQTTIQNSVSLTGIGLHTGNTSTITFRPAPANSHYIFVRTDLAERVEIPALVDNVIDVSRGTTLGIIPLNKLSAGDSSAADIVMIHTVEHVLAALVGLGIDNCYIEVTNNEPPVFDGSSIHYVNVLQGAGIEELATERVYFEVTEQITFKNDAKQVDMVALPLDDYRLTVLVDYFNEALGSQHTGLFNMTEFVEQFASARTFCFLSEVEMLIEQGLIKGGSLDSAIVIVDKEATDKELLAMQKAFNMKNVPFIDEKSGILNGTKLRYKNEPARHKLLDLIGDLALVGVPLKAQILAARPGHASNVEFAKKIRKQYLEQKIRDRINPKKNKKVIIDINKIIEIMPHRYPFLLVDRITHIDMDENIIVGIKNVTINEPFFQGHFPNKPIMPGVLICEAMGQVGGLIIWYTQDVSNKLMFFAGMKNVKFKKPVIPGDQLVYEVKLISQKFGIILFKGTAYVDNEVVFEAEYTVALINK